MDELILEPLTEQNLPMVRAIRREDVSTDFVDDADTLWEVTCYGAAHGCLGHTFAIRWGEKYIGALLLGEAIPWDTDPPEMARQPFYRLMCFVLDARWRSQGLGGRALEAAIARVYADFGPRPIALGVHRDNHRAAAFYQRHGFRPADAWEGNDQYYLRYPPQ